MGERGCIIYCNPVRREYNDEDVCYWLAVAEGKKAVAKENKDIVVEQKKFADLRRRAENRELWYLEPRSGESFNIKSAVNGYLVSSVDNTAVQLDRDDAAGTKNPYSWKSPAAEQPPTAGKGKKTSSSAGKGKETSSSAGSDRVLHPIQQNKENGNYLVVETTDGRPKVALHKRYLSSSTISSWKIVEPKATEEIATAPQFTGSNGKSKRQSRMLEAPGSSKGDREAMGDDAPSIITNNRRNTVNNNRTKRTYPKNNKRGGN